MTRIRRMPLKDGLKYRDISKEYKNYPLNYGRDEKLFEEHYKTSDSYGWLEFNVIDRYNEPFRFYHTESHLIELLVLINDLEEKFSKEFIADLKMVAYFHDVICDPRSLTNEEDSANYFKNTILDLCGFKTFDDSSDRIKSIYYAILDTKNHTASNELSAVFNQLDMYVISHYPMEKLFEYEDKIFKEFQHLDYKTYKHLRGLFLRRINSEYQRKEIDYLIDYVHTRVPKIGIYTGSFKPFHLGHYNVVTKAQKIFDKVIVARGINPDKEGIDTFETELEKVLPYIETVKFEGYAFDYADSVRLSGADVYFIKGLRNEQDLTLEMTQDRYNEEIRIRREYITARSIEPIQTVAIFSDPKYSHISSSAIRLMEKIEKGSSSKLIFQS